MTVLEAGRDGFQCMYTAESNARGATSALEENNHVWALDMSAVACMDGPNLPSRLSKQRVHEKNGKCSVYVGRDRILYVRSQREGTRIAMFPQSQVRLLRHESERHSTRGRETERPHTFLRTQKEKEKDLRPPLSLPLGKVCRVSRTRDEKEGGRGCEDSQRR